MNRTLNVVIVMGRCSRNRQGYGIRIEQRQGSEWVATWAFPIREEAARKERYDSSEVKGRFSLDSQYPGCPHCRARSFFRDGCGKVACWDGETRKVTCPWCNSKGELQGQIENISAGGDR